MSMYADKASECYEYSYRRVSRAKRKCVEYFCNHGSLLRIVRCLTIRVALHEEQLLDIAPRCIDLSASKIVPPKLFVVTYTTTVYLVHLDCLNLKVPGGSLTELHQATRKKYL